MTKEYLKSERKMEVINAEPETIKVFLEQHDLGFYFIYYNESNYYLLYKNNEGVVKKAKVVTPLKKDLHEKLEVLKEVINTQPLNVTNAMLEEWRKEVAEAKSKAPKIFAEQPKNFNLNTDEYLPSAVSSAVIAAAVENFCQIPIYEDGRKLSTDEIENNLRRWTGDRSLSIQYEVNEKKEPCFKIIASLDGIKALDISSDDVLVTKQVLQVYEKLKNAYQRLNTPEVDDSKNILTKKNLTVLTGVPIQVEKNLWVGGSVRLTIPTHIADYILIVYRRERSNVAAQIQEFRSSSDNVIIDIPLKNQDKIADIFTNFYNRDEKLFGFDGVTIQECETDLSRTTGIPVPPLSLTKVMDVKSEKEFRYQLVTTPELTAYLVAKSKGQLESNGSSSILIPADKLQKVTSLIGNIYKKPVTTLPRDATVSLSQYQGWLRVINPHITVTPAIHNGSSAIVIKLPPDQSDFFEIFQKDAKDRGVQLDLEQGKMTLPLDEISWFYGSLRIAYSRATDIADNLNSNQIAVLQLFHNCIAPPNSFSEDKDGEVFFATLQSLLRNDAYIDMMKNRYFTERTNITKFMGAPKDDTLQTSRALTRCAMLGFFQRNELATQFLTAEQEKKLRKLIANTQNDYREKYSQKSISGTADVKLSRSSAASHSSPFRFMPSLKGISQSSSSVSLSPSSDAAKTDPSNKDAKSRIPTTPARILSSSSGPGLHRSASKPLAPTVKSAVETASKDNRDNSGVVIIKSGER